MKDLSGFKTLRSVLEDVCSVLLASAEKFDTQNEVNVKERKRNGTTKSQDQPHNTRLNAIPRNEMIELGRMTSCPKGCIEAEEPAVVACATI